MDAILLAGGKSKRFGRNKALIEIEGKPLIERIVNRLKGYFDSVYLITNTPADYNFLGGIQIYEDIVSGKGPIGGLYTGLYYSRSRYNFLSACDMPNLSAAYIDFLLSRKRDYDVLVPEYKGYIEPLAGIYSRDVLPDIENCLRSGHLKVKDFFADIDLRVISEGDIRAIGDPGKIFYNINYREDLKYLFPEN